MTPITDNQGNIVGYYDDNFLAYDASGNPIMANNQQAIWDPNNNVLIDASAIPDATTSTPPAGVSQTDWLSLLTEAVPKVVTGIQAYQLSQVNVKRAQAGLPPLNAALYAPGQAGFVANMSSTSMLLIAGLAAVFLIGKR